MHVQSLGREDTLEEDMTTHSSILVWRILWTEEPGRLQCIGLHRVRHNWAMAPHSSTLAWRIRWTEEPGGLQSMGSLGVGHDWWLPFHFSLSCTGEGNSNPLQCSCLENPRDGGAWWAAIYGVAQSRTRLKRLSTHIPGHLNFSLLYPNAY